MSVRCYQRLEHVCRQTILMINMSTQDEPRVMSTYRLQCSLTRAQEVPSIYVWNIRVKVCRLVPLLM